MGNKVKVISKKKVLAFKLIACALPFLALLVLESGLRLYGYGHDLSLFVADSDYPDCLVMNKYFSERYFTDGVNATIGNFEPFKNKKGKGTVRMFVLGESTTIGYPYMHNGSFHRWLKYRLIQMYPQAEFEIINLSLTAVNSYTVLDMAKELNKYEPDAVLIYSGHNEYYGALGVGSNNKLGNAGWAVQALIKLKEYRVVQLIFNSISRLKRAKINPDKTMMERMAADQHIRYRSGQFNKGVEQFRRNINAVCKLLSDQKIPVFISTLVSNEKDMKPFISNPGEGVYSADSQYRQGQAAYGRSDTLNARRLFINAKEHDLLRFRAPEQMNVIIKQVSTQYPNVYLVDSRHFFAINSHYGILGKETLLEHVHPDLFGYSLMCEAFFKALKAHRILPPNPSLFMSLKQLQGQMPITRVDSLFGVYSVMQLKKEWPFNLVNTKQPVPTSVEGKIAIDMLQKHLPWNNAMDEVMNYYQQQNDQKSVLKVAEAVMLEYPQDPTFYAVAGQICAHQDEIPKAVNYLHRAFVMKPSIELARILFTLELKREYPDKAINYINYALAANANDAALLRVKEILMKLIGLQQLSKAHPGDSLIRKQVRQTYSFLNKPNVPVQ
jgi:tetratricopeptide (TPR) repeat protein